MEAGPKFLILIGASFVVAGIAWWIVLKVGLPLGRLPGDVKIEREGFSFYFPVATCIVVSLILSLVMKFLKR